MRCPRCKTKLNLKGPAVRKYNIGVVYRMYYCSNCNVSFETVETIAETYENVEKKQHHWANIETFKKRKRNAVQD